MLNKIINFIEENSLLKNGDKILVAISGGADSVCLFKVLLALKSRYNLSLCAVHINHNIRGEEALRDQSFVAEMCKKEGIELLIYSYDIPALSKKEGLTEEETGRNYRYKAFYKAAQKISADKIALAHNKNDNAETMLQRLLRGTGLKGLGGILPKRDKIIRPLLCLSRAEIEAFLGDTPYVTDSTNQSLQYLRNKIRLSLIPALEEINPNITEGLFRTAALIRRENDFLERQAEKALSQIITKKTANAVFLSCDRLLSEDEVIQNRVLRLACLPLTKKGQDIEYKHIEGLKALAGYENNKKISLIEGISAKKESDTLAIGRFNENPPQYSYELYPERELYINEANLSLLLTENKLPKKELGRLNPDILTFPLTVRTKKPGDRLKIKSGSQQIKKIYSENKIPLSARGRFPLLTDQNNILSVIGLKSAPNAFTPDGRLYLYITYL